LRSHLPSSKALPIASGPFTIGNGVTVKPSELKAPGAGNGAFVTVNIKKHQLITEYDGKVIDKARADYLRSKGFDTHIRGLTFGYLAIDGLKRPVFGRGGASFANDPKVKELCNVKFVKTEKVILNGAKREGIYAIERIFLKATKDIDPGSELYVDYGKDYWDVERDE
jgi:uncharacterized protein